jgi:hypothetical protein
MPVTAGIGLATTMLELTATSIGFGVVVIGFVTSSRGMLFGWTRKEVEAGALRSAFWGGVVGMFCLCLDLIVRYPGWI